VIYMSEQQSVTLTEAVTKFLATLSPEERQENQQELNKFIHWHGGERPVSTLNPKEVGDYADSISTSLTDATRKLEPVKNFLSFVRKKKLVDVSLAQHLRVSKGKIKVTRTASLNCIPASLTPEGYATLTAELETLKHERPHIAEQIRHAAADKDFRENAPLEAAREHQGQVEARIRDLEAILKGSRMAEEKPVATQTAGIGCTIGLYEPSSGELFYYTLVSPSEANPAKGKISIISPIGKAVMDHQTGAEVEVLAPVGKLRYQIKEIKG